MQTLPADDRQKTPHSLQVVYMYSNCDNSNDDSCTNVGSRSPRVHIHTYSITCTFFSPGCQFCSPGFQYNNIFHLCSLLILKHCFWSLLIFLPVKNIRTHDPLFPACIKSGCKYGCKYKVERLLVVDGTQAFQSLTLTY